MRQLLLFALLACAASLAHADTPAQPTAGGVRNHAGDDAGANEDLAKELESYHRQAEEVLQRVDNLAKMAPVAKEHMDATKERALRLANDDRFLDSAKALWMSEKRATMLIAQGVWFLLMLVFKAWRQSKAQHWFRKMLIGAACFVLTWAGLLYVIPLAVLGEPFWVFTGTLWRVLVLGL